MRMQSSWSKRSPPPQLSEKHLETTRMTEMDEMNNKRRKENQSPVNKIPDFCLAQKSASKPKNLKNCRSLSPSFNQDKIIQKSHKQGWKKRPSRHKKNCKSKLLNYSLQDLNGRDLSTFTRWGRGSQNRSISKNPGWQTKRRNSTWKSSTDQSNISSGLSSRSRAEKDQDKLHQQIKQVCKEIDYGYTQPNPTRQDNALKTSP